MAVSGGVSRAETWTGWGAAVDARVAGPLVASGFATTFDYDASEVDLRQVGAGIAWEAPVGDAAGGSKIAACPRAALAYAWPDDDRHSIDAWTGSATVAAALARAVGPVRAIAFVDAGVAVTRAAIEDVSDTTTDGILTVGGTVSGSRLFGTVSVEATTADDVGAALGLAAGIRIP